MAIPQSLPTLLLLLSLFTFAVLKPAIADARKLAMVQQQPLVFNYHNGPLLKGNYAVNIIWYGRFTAVQRAVISDFISSLSPPPSAGAPPPPTAGSWWSTTSLYLGKQTVISLGRQLLDENCSLGKLLKETDIAALAEKAVPPSSPTKAVALVLTSDEVAVDGFCSARCGTHGSLPHAKSRTAYVWVGNSVTQCPGQCAWPFHKPIYGPQTSPLVAPNGDVGIDGMIINIATLLAGTVTNPFGNGFYQGSAQAPLEAVTACTGMFGTGAYPGYPGKTVVDVATGASYNANGVNGRKYLLPAMWNPKSSQCTTLV